jgi:hypothetical protein
MNRYLFFLLGPFLFASCCAGHSVTLENGSGEDQLITIRGHRYSSLHRKGYFELRDLSGGGKAKRVEFIRIDSAENAYTFNLPKRKKIRIQGGLGYPDLDQQVIANNNDTIRLKGDPRTTIKYTRIDYFFKVTVQIAPISPRATGRTDRGSHAPSSW